MGKLLIDLGFIVVKSVLSGIAWAIVTGITLTAASAFSLITVPVAGAVIAGLVIAFVVGWAISEAVDATGLQKAAKKTVEDMKLPAENRNYAQRITW